MMVEYAGQDIELEVSVIPDGWWAIDKVEGKKLMAISLTHHKEGLYLNYVPTTNDIAEIIRRYLDCECANDNYVFPNGSKRPAELHKKIAELKDAMKEFEPTRMDELY